MWQLILKTLLREKIQAAVLNQASEMMRERAAGARHAESPADEAGEEAASEACVVGIVCATAAECGGIEDQLTDVSRVTGDGVSYRVGRLGSHVVAIAKSGIGQALARKATLGLIQGHRPAWIISAGFSGGLQGGIGRGDMVLGSAHVDEARQRITVDVAASAAAQSSSDSQLHVGTLLTAGRVIRTPEEKRDLGKRYEALAVDMESLEVARVCAREKVRFLAVRVIIDAVDDSPPRELGRTPPQAPQARRWGAALGALINRPSYAADVLRQKERELVTADRLGNFLVQMINHLVRADAS